jgi:aminopeptidase N
VCGFETTSTINTFVTRFEPALAKTVLPCWDEPSAKAVFNVSIKYPRKYVMLTNTQEVLRIDHDGVEGVDYVISFYAPTPPMSTYLLAFAMGEWSAIETETESGVPVRFYASVYRLDSLQVNK